MRDSEFKALKHPIGQMAIASRGSAVSHGYKPDLTVRDANGTLRFILESERKTDRKAFLGDLLKASRHAHEIGARPGLVIVMTPSASATLAQIASQVCSYTKWLSQNLINGLALSSVHLLTHDAYLSAAAAEITIGSDAFNRLGVHVPIAA